MRRLILLVCLLILLSACGGNGDSDSSNTNSDSTPAATTADTTQTQTASEPTNTALTATDTPAPQLAAMVNGEPITLEALNAEMALYETGSSVEAATREALMASVLDRLIDETLIRQAGAQMGITITEEQIDAEMEVLASFAAQGGISAEAFFAQQGFTAETIREELRFTLMTQAVNAQVVAAVPNTIREVHARHILVADLATAQAVLEQLNAGADFAVLAEQYSLDPTTFDAGGDLGWVGPGDLIQSEVEAAIFALPANSRYPEPVQSVLGYHIIEAIEVVEGQPMEPADLAEVRAQAWTRWLEQQRASADIQRYVGPNAQ